MAFVPDSVEGNETTVSAPNAPPAQNYPRSSTVPSLSGAERFSPGSNSAAPSYILPSFELTGFADTNPTDARNRSELEAQSEFLGNITLQRVRSRSQLNLNYSAGAFFYAGPLVGGPNPQASRNGTFHSLGITQTHTWRRWQILAGDNFSYLPESALGFAGFGGLESFGTGLGGSFLANAPSLNPAFLPDQSILTGRGRRVSNAIVTQVQYTVGERSSISASGSYGFLNFLDPGFTDNHYWVGQVGYNRALTRRDTLSVSYVTYLFLIQAANRDILSHGLQFAYGHKVTGKISVQLSGGPLFTQFALPLGGSVTTSFWSTYDSLQYNSGKGSAELSFLRTVSGGSGVLFGAETNQSQLAFSRQLSRKYSGSASLIYVFDRSLAQQDPNQRRSNFQSWQVGLSLSRELGPNASVYIQYNLQRQITNDPPCFGGNCGAVFVRQVGGVGFNWHGRPRRIH